MRSFFNVFLIVTVILEFDDVQLMRVGSSCVSVGMAFVGVIVRLLDVGGSSSLSSSFASASSDVVSAFAGSSPVARSPPARLGSCAAAAPPTPSAMPSIRARRNAARTCRVISASRPPRACHCRRAPEARLFHL